VSELRKDPITGSWVILSDDRGQRPKPAEQEQPIIPRPSFCPFCQGNEEKTPPEVFALRDRSSGPDERGWRIRVVQNKFPALTTEGDLEPRGKGIYDWMNGIGVHEVIIEGPAHHTRITELPRDFLPDILEIYRQRLQTVARDARITYGLIFKNVGEVAGASLEHNHSQLIATPVVPTTVAQEMEGARRFHDYRGRCIYCDIINQELEQGDRVIHEGQHFIVIAPFASRFPFESWILPRSHRSSFTTITTDELCELSQVLSTVLQRLDAALDRPPYNYVIHTSPFSEGETPHYHWHLEILPRVIRMAGFEFGTGYYINTISPEEATRTYRQMLP
jgi:UDPglucose--hexose-1-phosphate uridylyltransferase